MPVLGAADLLGETRLLLREARVLMDGESARPAPRSGVLGLYETLCRALDGIDGERVRVLLARISEQVAKLNELSQDVERIRRLRKSMGAG